MAKPTVAEAIEVICEALRSDRAYFDSWQANIAMCVYDALPEGTRRVYHAHCNDGAARFLRMLSAERSPSGD